MGTYNTICACAPDDTNARTADSDSQENTEQLIQMPKKLRNLTADRKTHVLLILTSCNVHLILIHGLSYRFEEFLWLALSCIRSNIAPTSVILAMDRVVFSPCFCHVFYSI